MNIFVASGRLTKDAEMKGKIANAVLACDRPFPFNKNKDGDKVTDFLNLKFIGEKNAERAEKYLHKGVKIELRGIVCRDNYKKDDEYKEYNYIIVEDWEFAESKNAAKSNDSSSASNPANDAFMGMNDSSFDDSGIPFD